jgi:hypothetical protein
MRTVTAARGRNMRRGLVTACLSAGLTAGLTAALTGCGTRAANMALPDKHGHIRVAGATASRSSASRPSARALVIAAYEAYWRATNDALASRDATQARTIMAGHVPASSIPALVTGMRAIWRRDEIGYGSPVFHIISVKLTGPGRAAVHDCIDLSHTGFANQQTGQMVGGYGQSRDFLITTLALEDGRWLVTGAIQVVQRCSY